MVNDDSIFCAFNCFIVLGGDFLRVPNKTYFDVQGLPYLPAPATVKPPVALRGAVGLVEWISFCMLRKLPEWPESYLQVEVEQVPLYLLVLLLVFSRGNLERREEGAKSALGQPKVVF